MRHSVTQNKIPTKNKCAEALGDAVRRTKPYGYSAGAVIDDSRFS
jgi:hypothetical protein